MFLKFATQVFPLFRLLGFSLNMHSNLWPGIRDTQSKGLRFEYQKVVVTEEKLSDW